MKAPKLLAAAFAAFLALAAVTPQAEARDRVRGSVTFHFGYGWPGYWWGPGYWGPRYPYAYWPPAYYPAYPPVYVPPVVAAPAEPPVYVERDAPEVAPAPAQTWWYWCPSANAYYPYVKECPGGWQRVPPQPPAAPQNR